ncbi:MAG: hypothetical protein HQL06_06230 [Nitrospirae bacterium]|nr:hypothetical protein [Nitrospirota bacterium]
MIRSIRIMLMPLFVVFLSVISGMAADESNIQLNAYVDKNSVYTGDTINYTIEVRKSKGLDLQLTDYNTGSDNLTIVDSSTYQTGFFNKSTIRRYKLRSYTPGTYKLPPAVVKYKRPHQADYNEVKTAELTVEVKSTLKETATTDIKDIKDLEETKKPWLYVIIGATVLALMALITYLIRKRRAAKAKPLVRKAAHEIAYEDLDRLRASNLLSDGLIKEYFTELSAIVRHYIEDRFSLKAPEMTTEEFLDKMKTSAQLPPAQKELLKDFLKRSDMVKFARYGPTSEEIEASFAAAKRFVDETKTLEKTGTNQYTKI